MDEAQGREAELGRDVVLDAGRGGGGEGDDGGGPQQGQAAAQQAVVGPEVVAPFRDAVGLVHRHERGGAPGQGLREAGHAEPLGGDEEEVEAPVLVGGEGLARAPAVAARVDALGAQAQGLELRDLVFHEGDEGRDHEGRAAAGEAGELVAERLARARGHDQQHVLALGHRAAHRLLPRPEGLEAERRAQQVVERLRRRGDGPALGGAALARRCARRRGSPCREGRATRWRTRPPAIGGRGAAACGLGREDPRAAARGGPWRRPESAGLLRGWPARARARGPRSAS